MKALDRYQRYGFPPRFLIAWGVVLGVNEYDRKRAYQMAGEWGAKLAEADMKAAAVEA